MEQEEYEPQLLQACHLSLFQTPVHGNLGCIHSGGLSAKKRRNITPRGQIAKHVIQLHEHFHHKTTNNF